MPMALVCGLPSSGNRLVRAHIIRSGIHARVWHGYPKDGALDVMTARFEKVRWEQGITDSETKIVIPVRSQVCRGASAAREYSRRAPHIGPDDQAAIKNVMRYALAVNADVLHVSYEALIEDPDGEGARIQEFCGGRVVPFPPEIPEGERRFDFNGPVVDANAKYREVLSGQVDVQG